MTTYAVEGARRKRHEKRESLYSSNSRAVVLVSRVSPLRRSTLARECTPLPNLKKKREITSSLTEDSFKGTISGTATTLLITEVCVIKEF